MKNFLNNLEVINYKKIIIAIIILLFFILLFILLNSKKEIDQTENLYSVPTKTSTVFFSKDKTASVELANSLKLTQLDSESGYILELKSNNNLNIYVSKEETLSNKTLSEIVNADKEIYLQNFSNTSNISDLKELLVGENPAYIYSLHYLDNSINQAFYLQVIWLQIDNYYYVFDIEFPLDDLSIYTNIATDVLSTFETY